MGKIQIMYIHGGHTFNKSEDYIDYLKNRKIKINNEPNWSDKYLDQELGELFQIIKPKMPLKENSKYEEWKIHFEKHLPFLKDNIILIGNSLGGIFLAKYLSENQFPKKILSTFLICPPFDNDLIGEDLAGEFELKEDISLLNSNSGTLRLLFSESDDIVPISHADKYKKRLDNALIIKYKDKNGHFVISEFPEIIKMIKEDYKKFIHPKH